MKKTLFAAAALSALSIAAPALAADMAPAYRCHRLFLQHLQSRHPATRWVLKSPGEAKTRPGRNEVSK